jgi:hypothetical protein
MLGESAWSRALPPQDDEPNRDLNDEIRRQDGLERHWVFFNGEQYRLFAAIVGGFCAVLWCFLYILGLVPVLRVIVGVLAFVCFLAWRLLDRQLRAYEDKGWRKDHRTVKLEKIEIRVAIGLWLFIVVSISAIMLWQWRHPH